MTWVDSVRRRGVHLFRSDTRRAVATISLATVLAQLLAAAATPLLTRLYSADEYGSFFIVFSVSQALAASFALRLELAVPLPRNDSDARSLVGTATAASGAFLVLVLIVTAFGRRLLSEALGLDVNLWIIVLVGPLAASFATAAVLNAVAIREARFRAIATRSILVGALTVVFQLIGGIVNAGVAGLAISAFVAQFVGIASLYIGSPLLRSRSARSNRAQVLRRYRRFPLVLGPAGLINSLGENTPLLVVGALYGPEAAGYFGLTLRVVAVPVAVVGAAAAQVFGSELARRRREETGTEPELFLKASRSLGLLALGFGAVLALAGPGVFRFVFGPDWAQAGDMARAFALAAAVQIVASPLSQTLGVYERVVAQFFWDSSRLVLTVGSLAAAWALGAPLVTAVWMLSVVAASCYAANWVLCHRTVTSDRFRAVLVAQHEST